MTTSGEPAMPPHSVRSVSSACSSDKGASSSSHSRAPCTRRIRASFVWPKSRAPPGCASLRETDARVSREGHQELPSVCETCPVPSRCHSRHPRSGPRVLVSVLTARRPTSLRANRTRPLGRHVHRRLPGPGWESLRVRFRSGRSRPPPCRMPDDQGRKPGLRPPASTP